MSKRPRYPRWLQWLRRRYLEERILKCVRCKIYESVGPDLLCEGCLTECENDSDIAEMWIQDD